MRKLSVDALAGIVTILTVHQPLILVLKRAGFVTWQAFDVDAVAPFGIPAIVSACLWGAIWTLAIVRVSRASDGSARHLRAAILGGVLTTAVGAILILFGHGTPITGMSPAVAAICSLCVNGVWSGAASWTAARFHAVGRSWGQSP
jgi:hypothetical protein